MKQKISFAFTKMQFNGQDKTKTKNETWCY